MKIHREKKYDQWKNSRPNNNNNNPAFATDTEFTGMVFRGYHHSSGGAVAKTLQFEVECSESNALMHGTNNEWETHILCFHPLGMVDSSGGKPLSQVSTTPYSHPASLPSVSLKWNAVDSISIIIGIIVGIIFFI